MVAVFAHGGADLGALAGKVVGVGIVEAVAFVAEPQADHDAEAVVVEGVEQRAALDVFFQLVHAPGADGGRAESGGESGLGVSADAVEGERGAVAGQRPTCVSLDEAHFASEERAAEEEGAQKAGERAGQAEPTGGEGRGELHGLSEIEMRQETS